MRQPPEKSCLPADGQYSSQLRWSAAATADAHFGFGKNGQRWLGGKHAARAVTAKRNDLNPVPGFVLPVDEFRKGLAARKSVGPLCHGRARRVESSQGQGIEASQQIDNRTGDHLPFQLLVGDPGGISRAFLESVGPVVVGRAVPCIAEGSKFGAFGRRACFVGIGIAGGIGDDIGHRNAELIMDAVCHLVAGGELPARGVPCKHDLPQIGKNILARQLQEDLVHEVIRCQLPVAGRHAARTPAVP